MHRITAPSRVVVALVIAIALAACASPMSVSSDAGPSADATTTTQNVSLPFRAPLPPARVRALPGTPAPAARIEHARAPSGALSCALTRPAGDCDRCPDRACRQVRVPTTENEPTWAMFCEQGDLYEEARIACLCAGGDARACAVSARDTMMALQLIDHVFGGDVPSIGTRYSDGYGLRAVVDDELHGWLASVAGPAPVLRCSVPDREGAALAYEERAQRVRMTGSCRSERE